LSGSAKVNPAISTGDVPACSAFARSFGALQTGRMQDLHLQGRRRIDVDGWERESLFKLFGSFGEPYHGVCIRVDCTETYLYAKRRGHSVFLSLLHRSLVAAQLVQNFRTHIADNAVWLYDQVNAGSPVGRPNGTIGFAHYVYLEKLDDFVREASVEVERVRGRTDLERYPESNVIRYSTLPWFDFTSISHARNLSDTDSSPRITFGKMTEASGRRSMPVSIHVHHGLVDGLHVAQLVQQFERLLREPEWNPST
jgi:chloramphenicol O-acetyltransferase type A